jgi:5-methylthioadenosine/S-adenosylhomocysteine deaminase
VVPVAPGPRVLEWHTVVVREDRIHEVLPTSDGRRRYPDATRVDLRGQALIPGLVNAHTHAAMSLLRGLADDMPLMEWLQTRIWPAEARFVSDQFVADGTAVAALEMVLGGITTFNDMYFFPQGAIRSAVATGIRIQSGLTYVATPTPYARSEDEYIERGLDAVAAWQGTPLVSFAWAPHSTYAASTESWDRLPQLLEAHPFPLHTHVQETLDEVDRAVAQDGLTPLARIHRAGLLRSPFAGAHGVHLRDGDLDLLAGSGASIVHCPSSNLKLASGIAPVVAMLTSGVNVAIGTDGAASNNRLDMWQEMRAAALLAKAQTGDAAALSAHQALTMATLGGARALGQEALIGSIEVGKAADLVSVDLSGVAAQPTYHPISHLVYVAGREDVTNVWVAGRPVVVDRRCTTVDTNEVLARCDDWREQIWSGRPD